MPRVKNKARSRRRKDLRQRLFEALGGRCMIRAEGCDGKLTADTFEVHHEDGCAWNQRMVNAETRLYRYLRELREGVRLAAACRHCNGMLNQATYGTREERAAA